MAMKTKMTPQERSLHNGMKIFMAWLAGVGCLIGYFYEWNHPDAPRFFRLLPGGIPAIALCIIGMAVFFGIARESGE